MVVLLLTIAGVPATIVARHDTLANYYSSPVLFAIPVGVLLALAGIIHYWRKQNDRKSFACSCMYLTLMLIGAAVALYPRLLPSSGDSGLDITISKAVAGPYALRVGLLWWAFGMCLAVIYFVVMYRMFRGKITVTSGECGD
jgi:cytochrome d ubiquinol oxidase subunit II